MTFLFSLPIFHIVIPIDEDFSYFIYLFNKQIWC